MTEKYGTYHACNGGCCSWEEFAQEIFRIAKMEIKVIPIQTEDYPVRARRPKNSRMSTYVLTNNGFGILENWKFAIKTYFS